jgi:TatD DNase family protein
MIDTHAHLDMNQFDTDREDAIKRARQAGVGTIVTVGTDLVSSRKAIDIAGSHQGIFAAVGFHPQDARLMNPGDDRQLAELGKKPKVVAIGEIGLDYYRVNSPKQTQVNALRSQLELAADLGLPVIIHSRQADADVTALLHRWTATLTPARLPGVIHCFNGTKEIAETYLEMGFYIAFGAYTGYPSSRLAEVVRSIPEDRLLTETDSPFLPPQAFRGKRNEPAYIPIVIDVIARLRGQSIDTIARQTEENAKRLFNL